MTTKTFLRRTLFALIILGIVIVVVSLARGEISTEWFDYPVPARIHAAYEVRMGRNIYFLRAMLRDLQGNRKATTINMLDLGLIRYHKGKWEAIYLVSTDDAYLKRIEWPSLPKNRKAEVIRWFATHELSILKEQMQICQPRGPRLEDKDFRISVRILYTRDLYSPKKGKDPEDWVFENGRVREEIKHK